jgi:hypothetical protein
MNVLTGEGVLPTTVSLGNQFGLGSDWGDSQTLAQVQDLSIYAFSLATKDPVGAFSPVVASLIGSASGSTAETISTISPNGTKEVFRRYGQLWVRMVDGSQEWSIGVDGSNPNWLENWIITFDDVNGHGLATDQFMSFVR